MFRLSAPASLPRSACRFPVNLLFVGMIGSSFYALKLVGVGMVTVWKNLSNFVTAMGDVFIFHKRCDLRKPDFLLLHEACTQVWQQTQ